MLLGTGGTSASTLLAGGNPSVDDGKPNPIEEFLHHISGQEKEQDAISIDHSYSKLWSSHPDSHHAKPARLLFMKSLCRSPDSGLFIQSSVDVEYVESAVAPPYDNVKTRGLMADCDVFLKSSLSQELEEAEQLNKTAWSTSQRNLYKNVMKVLQSNRLSRLASVGTAEEVVKRRIVIDKAARRIRQLFSANMWDMKLLCWLHQTLMDSLSAPLLSEYFEILRTLKAKIPNLIDKLLAQVTSFHSGIFGNCSTEAFTQLLRKPWDPVLSLLNQHKPKKLVGNPLFLVVPGAPNQTVANQTHRMRFFNNQMSSLGKVIHSPVHAASSMAVDECLDQIFTSTRNRVAELKSQHSTRPVILIGWTIGALIACHIALEESVSAVVCFGFPLKGVNGSRGDLDDPLLDSKVPTLFLIGQNSSTCCMDDIEDFRERMKAETGLVVVGGADDMLRVAVAKKKTEGVTQAMVDRCVVDEVGEFLSSVLSQQFSSHALLGKRTYSSLNVQSRSTSEEAKRPRRRPREYSPDFSPVKRKPRHVGGPPEPKISTSSSSDTSSTGSCASEGAPKGDRKRPSPRKVGRPPSGVARKRPVSKSIGRSHKASPIISLKKDNKEIKTDVHKSARNTLQPSFLSNDLLPNSSSGSSKNPSTSFLPVVDQLKNAPVDVEKAFGRDSSFLPRPLTPADVERSDIPALTSNPVLASKSSLESEVESAEVASAQQTSLKPCTFLAVSQPNVFTSSEKPKISYLKTATTSCYPFATFSTHVNSTVAIQKPQVVSKIAEPVLDSSKVHCVQKAQCSDLMPGSLDSGSIKSLTSSQTKIIPTSGLSIKHVQNTITSFSGKSLLSTSTMGLSSKPQTILVASSASSSKPTTYFMTNSDNYSSTAKKIHLRRMVVKNPSSASAKLSLPLLSKLSSASSGGGTDDSSQEKTERALEQKVCNLSLLSDVAVMKEPIRQLAPEVHSSPTATLVKLSSAGDASKKNLEKAGPSQLRRFRVIEAMPTSSPPPLCVETPEEFAEKQMAIRALNSSLNEEADSSGSYSICYSKSDGSVVSRPLSMLGYSVMAKPGSTSSFRAGQGTPTIRKPRIQRFYPF